MADQKPSEQERLNELRDTAEAIGKLAQDEAAFTRTAEAFRAQNAEAFQSELSKLGLLPRCHLICRWLCSKHCVFLCTKICREPATGQLSIAEMREFAQVTERLGADEALLKRFLDVVDREDADGFNRLLVEFKWQRFCHQLCHFLCMVRCRLVCKLLCPPRPVIKKVGLIPTAQIDAAGRAAGPSFPPGPTPNDNKPAGVGDHPFGGLTNIEGLFNIASPYQYKVEFAPAIGGPWTAIKTPVLDFDCSVWPFSYYYRNADAAGWYNIDVNVGGLGVMGCLGKQYLTDWQTPADRDKLYYLKLTVRNALLVEFESLIVPARVDNGDPQPKPPFIDLQLQTPDGKRRKLGCCERVERGNGNLLVITLQAWDENFSHIDVNLIGGCGWSFAIVDTGGVALSKTYNGNVADTGYPVPAEFLYDPWAAKVPACCYLIDVRIYDRTIVANHWSGGHAGENWHSITIA